MLASGEAETENILVALTVTLGKKKSDVWMKARRRNGYWTGHQQCRQQGIWNLILKPGRQ